MATVPATVERLGARQARRSSVILLLRLEGFAVAALTAVLYPRTGASWWLFAALWLAPDFSMLGYATGRPCWGARLYNAYHTYVAPMVLALAALALHAQLALAIALIWANHIGVDRMLGFGLKYADGFGFTHLGATGRKAR
jgi:hypothetical protein